MPKHVVQIIKQVNENVTVLQESRSHRKTAKVALLKQNKHEINSHYENFTKYSKQITLSISDTKA
jgi:hypothetical protein